MSISCAVAAAELHSAYKEDRRVARDVAAKVGDLRCVNFDSEVVEDKDPIAWPGGWCARAVL